MRVSRRSTLTAVSVALAVAVGLLAGPAGAQETAGDYIVVLKSSAERPGAVAAEHRRAHGAQVRATYEHALQGYAARLSGKALEAVRRDRRVAYVEVDGVVRTAQTVTQTPATWGLDRSDQRSLPLDGSYTYAATGTKVTAYVIDTGILTTHTQLTGRIASGFTAIADGRGTTDCNGHGTHVAGTVGGTVHGIAKGVTVVPVRVLDCAGSGSNSGVIAGIDWVVSNHAAGAPAVANLSLGGGASTAVDDAVNRLIGDGVTTVVAAGNDNRDACSFSPARVPAAITVGSTTNTDARSSFSNYGSCVDLFAPGSSITSAWHTSTTATNTISGTSMASPHAAGAAALHLQGSTGATPQEVRDALHAAATKGIVTSASSANNHLLHVPVPVPVPTDPVVTEPVAEPAPAPAPAPKPKGRSIKTSR